MNWPAAAVSLAAKSASPSRRRRPAAMTSPVSSATRQAGSAGWHSHMSLPSRALIAAQTCAASAGGLTAGMISGPSAPTAASTPCEIAHSARLAGSARTAPSRSGRGTGIGQPATCASTANSAHSLLPGSALSVRCASRISRSVHGRATHSAPHVVLLGRTTAQASLVTGAAAVSRSVPSLTLIKIGRSMPSANAAASPGASVTRYLDCGGVRLIVAPTASLSSAAGSRCTTLIAVFLMTSGMSLAGICSAMIRPSP